MTQTAQTYADALYELAKDEGLDDSILAQLVVVNQMLEENPDFVTLLTLPSVPKKERCGIAADAFQENMEPYLLNFLKMFIEKGTIGQMNGVLEQYEKRYNRDHGILAVTAVTAVPLSDSLREKLHQKLAQEMNKTVDLRVHVDPSILGGIRLEMDGKQLDGTVQTRLQELSQILRETVL